MSTWRARIEERKVLVSDGAWGTELSRLGLPAGDPPEKWNLERPDQVRTVPEAYVAAGSDIILTNTFGGSRLKLAKVGLDEQLVEINRTGAQISKQAAGDRALVFASVGPTGEFVVPLGTISEEEMVACFAEQIKALAEGGADGIVVETMADLGEAKAALRAAKDNTDLPVVVSLAYDKGPAGFATMMGVKPDQAAAEIEAAGADMVGSNCGTGIQDMTEVVRLMRPATSLAIWAKANAGLPELVAGKTVFKETPEQMAQQLPAIVQAGASIVGGCCGTTPDHIRLLVAECRKLAGAG